MGGVLLRYSEYMEVTMIEKIERDGEAIIVHSKGGLPTLAEIVDHLYKEASPLDTVICKKVNKEGK